MELEFGALKECLEGLVALLEEDNAEEALASCRFLLDLIAMFEGPFELDQAAFMAGVLGLPLPSQAAGS
jgi:hypothetical protein